jgi:hypothetical protein
MHQRLIKEVYAPACVFVSGPYGSNNKDACESSSFGGEATAATKRLDNHDVRILALEKPGPPKP